MSSGGATLGPKGASATPQIFEKISIYMCVCVCVYSRIILIKKKLYSQYLQKILSGKLLLVVTCAQKSYLSCGLKLELIITYHLRFIMKLL